MGKYNVLQDNIVEEQELLPLVRQVFEKSETVKFTLRYDSSQLKHLELTETAFLILDVTISPVLDATGRVTNAIIQHIDITERKRAEEALRASEERYRSLFDNSDDAVLLTAPDGRIFAANPAACRIVGRTEAEICQTGRAGVVDPTDPRLPIALEERERTGRFRGELTCLRSDGQPFPGEVTSVVFQGEAGQPRTSMIIRDITERKRAEEALTAERTLLRTIIDILPALVYVKDTACRKILANHVDLEYMGASTEAEALGKTDFDFYPEDMAARFYARDQAIIQTGQPLIDYEHSIVTADGRQRWLITSKVPLRDGAGQVIGLVGVGRDITERSRRRRRCARARIATETWWSTAMI
jgi:PAS domain S-box-containing protein